MDITSQIFSGLSNPAIAAPLVAAGIGGLGAGALTAESPTRPGESSGDRFNRILRNSLLTAGAAGLGTAGLQAGWNQLSTAVPVNSVDPVVQDVTNPAARALYAALGVGTAQGLGPGAKSLQKELTRNLNLPTSVISEDNVLNPAFMGGVDGKAKAVRDAIGAKIPASDYRAFADPKAGWGDALFGKAPAITSDIPPESNGVVDYFRNLLNKATGVTAAGLNRIGFDPSEAGAKERAIDRTLAAARLPSGRSAGALESLLINPTTERFLGTGARNAGRGLPGIAKTLLGAGLGYFAPNLITDTVHGAHKIWEAGTSNN